MEIPHETYDGNGNCIARGAVAISADRAIIMIKAEAQRRILARYPQWKQINLTRTPQAVEMWAWIDAVRAKSNEMEQTQPSDYADDRHWPK